MEFSEKSLEKVLKLVKKETNEFPKGLLVGRKISLKIHRLRLHSLFVKAILLTIPLNVCGNLPSDTWCVYNNNIHILGNMLKG